VDDLLVECVDPDGAAGPEPERQTLRYLVIGSGGLLGLGLGRKRVAVPAALADVSGDPVRLRVEQAVVHAAPAYDDREPFSRRDEKAVNAFFGERPYWIDDPGSHAPPAPPAGEGGGSGRSDADEPPLTGLVGVPAI
jgi:hypothetical protein